MLQKRLRMQGFIVSDYGPHRRIPLRPDAMVKEGRAKAREDVVTGLEDAPSAFLGLLEGCNFGKLVVQLGV